jgi:hypothetical protein
MNIMTKNKAKLTAPAPKKRWLVHFPWLARAKKM